MKLLATKLYTNSIGSTAPAPPAAAPPPAAPPPAAAGTLGRVWDEFGTGFGLGTIYYDHRE